MITDMERIETRQADIAEILVMENRPVTMPNIPLEEMGKATSKMVTDSVEAYVRKDLEGAKAVIAYDDVVDKLFDEVKAELIRLIGQNMANGRVGYGPSDDRQVFQSVSATMPPILRSGWSFRSRESTEARESCNWT